MKLVHVSVGTDLCADGGRCVPRSRHKRSCWLGRHLPIRMAWSIRLPDRSALAQGAQLACHVDACRRFYACRLACYTVPGFDFSVPGVTSISAVAQVWLCCQRHRPHPPPQIALPYRSCLPPLNGRAVSALSPTMTGASEAQLHSDGQL